MDNSRIMIKSNEPYTLSEHRIKRLKAQGYAHCSNQEISAFAFGNRFAYVICASLVAIGVITANIPILLVLILVAFGAVILPYHPFDYIYNFPVRQWLKKPKLPPRSRQLKFACIVAIFCLSATIASFYFGYLLLGYSIGGLLLLVALIVITTDFCIPSTIYNFLFGIKIN